MAFGFTFPSCFLKSLHFTSPQLGWGEGTSPLSTELGVCLHLKCGKFDIWKVATLCLNGHDFDH